MRVLIIGGTGIISTGITRLLVERGDEVVLYNRGTAQVAGGRGLRGHHRRPQGLCSL